MAKKKTTTKKKTAKSSSAKPAKKTTARKSSAKKKPATAESAKKAEPKNTEPKNTEPKKTEPKKTEPKKTEPKKTEPKKSASLGRPRIPVDAQLDVVFQKDFQAREAFSVLDISTVRELIRFEPDQLVQQLTSPTIQTVGRIRKVLAIYNRALAGDEDFAIKYQTKLKDEDA